VRFGTATGWLPAEELALVRERLNQLAHEREDQGGSGNGSSPLKLGTGGAALLVLESCRRACSDAPRGDGEGAPILRRLVRALNPGEAVPTPGELASRVGLQQDYLNRLVRMSTGLTLGQRRARELLKECKHDLKKGGTIGGTALRLGFSDSNYFSRWFRRQTGMTPGAWKSRS
jgi:AraC-like DNA-binding protein